MQETPQDQPQAPVPQQPMSLQSQVVMKSHRGGAVLALGIIGIVVCFVTGIIAWVMGSNDLREMKEGLMDPEGEGLTRAGMICGIVGTVIAALGLVWFVFWIFIVGAAGALDAGGW